MGNGTGNKSGRIAVFCAIDGSQLDYLTTSFLQLGDLRLDLGSFGHQLFLGHVI